MLRCAIVPPVPVPYREELFARLAAEPQIEIEVIYQAASQASWDQARDWFPAEHGYAARHLRPLHLARRGRSPITWPRGLEAALSAFDPQVVVVSEFGPATLRCLAWCRRRRRAIVVFTEVTREGERALSPLQRTMHRALARRVDGFIAVSSLARQRLVAIGANPQHVTVSLQPVQEQALLDAAQSRRPVQQQPVEVLTVARLVPDKEIGSLIAAFAESGLARAAAGTAAGTTETAAAAAAGTRGAAAARDATAAAAGTTAQASPRAQLTLIGRGPLEAELRDQATRLRVPVHFEGALSAGQLPQRYAQASIFVLPSRYEPFGVALREAVVAGLPIICSNAVGAAADFARHGENAILYAPGDSAALAAALQLVGRDPQLRQRMGAASTKLAQEQTLARDVEAFAARISSAAQEARASR